MAEPFLSEIRIVSFNFAPRGWAFCDGQLLPISQNQSLFSLIGTIYGGDARTTFALPDLRGRTPIHMSSGYFQGERGGEEAHTLSLAELPSHTHAVNASTAPPDTGSPGGSAWAGQVEGYSSSGAGSDNMGASAVGPAGSSQTHDNMQPFLTLSFCIALQGIFPSRN